MGIFSKDEGNHEREDSNVQALHQLELYRARVMAVAEAEEGLEAMRFSYRIFGGKAEGASPFVQFHLGTYRQTDDGTVLVSEHLMTEREIRDWCAAIRAEADKLEKTAIVALRASS